MLMAESQLHWIVTALLCPTDPQADQLFHQHSRKEEGNQETVVDQGPCQVCVSSLSVTVKFIDTFIDFTNFLT